MNDDNNINIYPNPSSGVFTIENPLGFENLVSLEITDITGRKINNYQFSTLDSQLIIDLSSQKSGMYLLKFSMEDEIFTRKIIIQ